MLNVNILCKLLIGLYFTLVFGCSSSDSSSSGSSGSTSSTGQFKDSNTIGLNYVSGTISGVTDSDGSFTYSVGNEVSFFIGGVSLGSTQGAPVVTPIDLVDGGSSNSDEVQNIARFLMMLDDDGEPENGISISSSVQEAAYDWDQIDFSSTNFEGDLSIVINSAIEADGGTHVLPSASEAKSHLESTLLCSYSGSFIGTYTGSTDSGYFGITLDASSGYITGYIYSSLYESIDTINGDEPIGYDQDVAFTSGSVSTGATFNGNMTDTNSVAGEWDNSSDGGSLSGTRIASEQKAEYHFSALYSSGDSDFLVFAFNVSEDNDVSGIAYDLVHNKTVNLSGSLVNTSFNATGGDGSEFSGTMNKDSGVINGDWISDSSFGSFSGSGCKLN